MWCLYDFQQKKLQNQPKKNRPLKSIDIHPTILDLYDALFYVISEVKKKHKFPG